MRTDGREQVFTGKPLHLAGLSHPFQVCSTPYAGTGPWWCTTPSLSQISLGHSSCGLWEAPSPLGKHLWAHSGSSGCPWGKEGNAPAWRASCSSRDKNTAVFGHKWFFGHGPLDAHSAGHSALGCTYSDVFVVHYKCTTLALSRLHCKNELCEGDNQVRPGRLCRSRGRKERLHSRAANASDFIVSPAALGIFPKASSPKSHQHIKKFQLSALCLGLFFVLFCL